MKTIGQILKKMNAAWTRVVAGLVTITVLFGVYQVYDYFFTPNIAGEWYLTLTVQESSYRPYIGDIIGVKAYFTQTEKSLSGHGEKWEYRGKLLDYKDHSKLDFEGSLDGRTLKLNYVLHGKLRETTGSFNLEVTDRGSNMQGNFTGTAANTKGTIVGKKVM